MLQNHLQLTPAVIVSGPDEWRGGEQAGILCCIRDLPKALENSCFRKQGATLPNFMLYCHKIFVPTKFSKFMQVFAK